MSGEFNLGNDVVKGLVQEFGKTTTDGEASEGLNLLKAVMEGKFEDTNSLNPSRTDSDSACLTYTCSDKSPDKSPDKSLDQTSVGDHLEKGKAAVKNISETLNNVLKSEDIFASVINQQKATEVFSAGLHLKNGDSDEDSGRDGERQNVQVPNTVNRHLSSSLYRGFIF